MDDPPELPDFPPPPDEHPLRGQVLDLLLDAGHQPELDDDGDVEVRVQGQQLYLRCVEGDITILRVFGQWRLVDVEATQLQLLQACNAVTARLSVAKATLVDGVLVVAVEHLVTGPEGLGLRLSSSLELVLAAVAVWNDTLERLRDRPGPAGGGEPV